MNKIIQALTSRTVGVISLAFLTAGFQGISNYFSPEVFMVIQGALSLLAAYFKVNPSQEYK